MAIYQKQTSVYLTCCIVRLSWNDDENRIQLPRKGSDLFVKRNGEGQLQKPLNRR